MIPAFCWPPAVPFLSIPWESHGQAGLASILSEYRQYCISERKGMSVSTLKRQGRCQFASHPHCNLQHFRPPPASSVSNMWHHCTSAFLSPIFFWLSPLLLYCWVAGWATFTKWATYAAEHLQDPQPIFYFNIYSYFYFTIRYFFEEKKIMSTEKGAKNPSSLVTFHPLP